MLYKLKPVAVIAITFTVLTGAVSVAWNTAPVYSAVRYQADTIPEQSKAKEQETIINGDLDKAMEQVKKAQENMDRYWKNGGSQELQKELEKVQAALNATSVNAQVGNALRNINLQKIQAGVQAGLQQIDWEKMQQALQQAQQEMNNNPEAKKISSTIQQAMEESKEAMLRLKTVDVQKLQQQLEQAKAAFEPDEAGMQDAIEKAKESIGQNMQGNIEKAMEKAKTVMNNAQAELKDYQDMLSEMDKDGLIKSKESYDIEYKNGELFINGTKQPENVSGKYRHYFKKDKVKLRRSKNEDTEKIIYL